MLSRTLPKSAKVKLSQASFKLRERAIGLFRYEVLDQISMRCKRKCLVAAKFGWADTAGFALTLDEPANGAQSQVVQLGNFFARMPGFNRCNGAFTQFVGVWLIHSYLAPCSQWESLILFAPPWESFPIRPSRKML